MKKIKFGKIDIMLILILPIIGLIDRYVDNQAVLMLEAKKYNEVTRLISSMQFINFIYMLYLLVVITYVLVIRKK